MPRVLIAGCGYLGFEVAQQFSRKGWDVIGLARAPRSGEAFPILSADLADASTLAGLPSCDVVIHSASSSRGGEDAYRRVFLEGLRNLLLTCPDANVIFTSSTSVYAQTDGSVVTEDSPAVPVTETGRILRQAEEVLLEHGGCVARLAGIYGPARSVLLRRFLRGEAVIEDGGTRCINQIHRDDAASAILLLAEMRASGVYNVCDDTPLSQGALYAWLAEYFAHPMPSTGRRDPGRKRGVTNKAVSNAKLRALGWAPRYPSFYDAVISEGESLV